MITDFTNTIDWDMFARQKQQLLDMADDQQRFNIEEADLLMGIVHLMDAVQDSFQPQEAEE